jgi:hypothetical protein
MAMKMAVFWDVVLSSLQILMDVSQLTASYQQGPYHFMKKVVNTSETQIVLKFSW